jgi:superfamily I DNA/RNA helicase
MALAKYWEEILERYHEDVQAPRELWSDPQRQRYLEEEARRLRESNDDPHEALRRFRRSLQNQRLPPDVLILGETFLDETGDVLHTRNAQAISEALAQFEANYRGAILSSTRFVAIPDLTRLDLSSEQAALLRRPRGVLRISGGPGTGKTLLLLHRAYQHVRRQDPNVVIFTASAAHQHDMQTMWGQLDTSRRLRPPLVTTERELMSTLYSILFQREPGRVLEQQEERELWADIRHRDAAAFLRFKGRVGSLPSVTRAPDPWEYLWEEFNLIQSLFVPPRAALPSVYRDLRRTGRGINLQPEARTRYFAAFQEWTAILRQERSTTVLALAQAVATRLAELLENPRSNVGALLSDLPSFGHLLVDESHEFGTATWATLARLSAMAGSGPHRDEGAGDFWLVGDRNQGARVVDRDFRAAFSGVRSRDTAAEFRGWQGASARLSIPYRSTATISRVAEGLRAAFHRSIENENDEEEAFAQPSAVVAGSTPVLVRAATRMEHEQFLDELLDTIASSGEAPASTGAALTIGLIGMTPYWGGILASRVSRLNPRAMSVRVDLARAGRHSATPHDSLPSIDLNVTDIEACRGREFQIVVVVGIAERDLVSEDAWRDGSDLYTAATRARSSLILTCDGPETRILDGLRDSRDITIHEYPVPWSLESPIARLRADLARLRALGSQ